MVAFVTCCQSGDERVGEGVRVALHACRKDPQEEVAVLAFVGLAVGVEEGEVFATEDFVVVFQSEGSAFWAAVSCGAVCTGD